MRMVYVPLFKNIQPGPLHVEDFDCHDNFMKKFISLVVANL